MKILRAFSLKLANPSCLTSVVHAAIEVSCTPRTLLNGPHSSRSAQRVKMVRCVAAFQGLLVLKTRINLCGARKKDKCGILRIKRQNAGEFYKCAR